MNERERRKQELRRSGAAGPHNPEPNRLKQKTFQEMVREMEDWKDRGMPDEDEEG